MLSSWLLLSIEHCPVTLCISYLEGYVLHLNSRTRMISCCCVALIMTSINTFRPRQNGRHFADDTFKRIFVNENVRILIEISLKFVSKGPINNILALVQIMAWRRPGDKPLFETMMVCLPTHICASRPWWVILSLVTRFWQIVNNHPLRCI